MRLKDHKKTETIFKATLQLIMIEGIAGITMAKLAKKAGIATGTLYIYFRNKEELFTQLYATLRGRSQARFLQGYTPEEPFLKGLKKVWMNYLKHRLEHYDESVFLEQYYRSPYITASQRKDADSMKNPVLQIINRGKEENIVKKDVDEELLFLSLLGVIRELADEHMMRGYKLNEERIEKAFLLCWDMAKA